MDATTGFTVLSTASYLFAGDGLAMGSGPYGSYTIFVPNIAYGQSPNITPAQVSAINRLNTAQEEALPNSVGGNLSGVTGPCIYYSSDDSPDVVLPGAQSKTPDVAQQMPLAGPSTNALPGTPPVVLSSQPIVVQVAGEVAQGSVPPQLTNPAHARGWSARFLLCPLGERRGYVRIACSTPAAMDTFIRMPLP